jgi:hypothetical protein
MHTTDHVEPSEAAAQIAANGLDDLCMLIEEIGDRRERWFQNYSLPQQLPVGEAELRIGGSYRAILGFATETSLGSGALSAGRVLLSPLWAWPAHVV